MTPDMQNPGVQAVASRDCCGGPSHPLNTASDWRVQMLASRFCLSPWMARESVRLCFGEGSSND